MIHLEFNEEEKQALYYERFNHPDPRVQKKMEALWLKSQKLPHHQIVQLVGISANTLRNYFRDYQEGGIEKLKKTNFYRPQSELENYSSRPKSGEAVTSRHATPVRPALARPKSLL